jgi:WD40 repeat protein
VRLWETRTGKEIARWPIGGGVDKLVFDSQSAILAVIGDGVVTLINSSTLSRVGILQQSGLLIQDAAFCPSGSIATSGREFSASDETLNLVYLWDVKDHRKDKTFQETGPMVPLLSVNGKYAVTWTDKKVNIWDLAAEHAMLDYDESDVEEVKFSPDEQYVVIRKNDGMTIRTVLREEEQGFISEESPVVETAFARDGKHLIAGLEDRTLRVLPTFRKTVIEDACQRLSQNLTQAEWGLYLSTEPYRKTCPERP